MQKAAAHRLHADALLHKHLAALQDWAAVPNVEVLDEQPMGQAAQQPPPQWTLPGDSVVLPGVDPPESRAVVSGSFHHPQPLLSLQKLGLQMLTCLASTSQSRTVKSGCLHR